MVEAMNFFQWVYSTIPFIQLMGNRVNILGFFWFILLMRLTYWMYNEEHYLFGMKTKIGHTVGLYAIAAFTTLVFYRILDEILTVMTVLSWDSSLLFGGSGFIMFWFGKILSFMIPFLGLHYLFFCLGLRSFFKISKASLLVLPFVLLVQAWSVTVFKVDYAVLSGLERIHVFWSFYPLLYLSYTFLYLTFLRGVTNGKK